MRYAIREVEIGGEWKPFDYAPYTTAGDKKHADSFFKMFRPTVGGKVRIVYADDPPKDATPNSK